MTVAHHGTLKAVSGLVALLCAIPLFGMNPLPKSSTQDETVSQTSTPLRDLRFTDGAVFHGVSYDVPNIPTQSRLAFVEQDVLTSARAFRTDGARSLSAVFGYLPEHPAFNDAVDDVLFQAIKQHDNFTQTRYSPKAQGVPVSDGFDYCQGPIKAATHDSDSSHTVFQISCSVVLAQGPFFAERIFTQFSPTPEHMEQSSHTIYTEVGVPEPRVSDFTGLAHDYDDLLLYVTKQVVSALPEIVKNNENDSFYNLVDDALMEAVFTREGDLLVGIPDDSSAAGHPDVNPIQVSPQPTPSHWIRIDGSAVEPYLSDFGQEIRRAVVTEQPFDFPSRALPGKSWVNCSLQPCLAVTFDDGPKPKHTEKVLQALKKYDAAATFFMMGTQVKKYPKLAQAVAADGHEVGGHSWNHPPLTSLTKKQLKQQFTKTNAALVDAIGQNPKYYRPPYGLWNLDVLKTSNQAGILWNVDSDDWRKDSDKKYFQRSLKVDVGDIVLFHDVQPQTVKNIDAVLAEYTSRGYALVTISQLFQDQPLKPKTIIYSR